MISRNFGRWLSLMGLLLILFSAVGPYFLHIPFAKVLLVTGIILNLHVFLNDLLGIRIYADSESERVNLETLDAPIDGAKNQLKGETKASIWFGRLSAIFLAAALILQILRMTSYLEDSVSFTWVIVCGLLFIIMDILRRVSRNLKP
jgi:hypothetical protein